MGMFDGFKKHYETGDHAEDQRLVTQYYRNNYKQVKTALDEVVKELNFRFAHEDDARQEHAIARQDCEVIVTMVKITPIETTVDFTVNTNGLLSFGKGRNVIQNLYQGLDKRLNRK